ncbi:MAG: SAF domain-containing protein, partial [Pseudomonadota bacterium]|nr:SAF domain-containing protein [Pseudomonadota bacterium]
MSLLRVPKFKPNKAWVVLGAALVIGLLAALAARNYLSNQMDAIEAKARGSQINVIVAKRELRRGERLSPDNVAVRPIPLDYAHSNAVTPPDFERLEGQALAFPVKAGEMVLWSLMEGKKAPTFSARVEAGRRAIT